MAHVNSTMLSNNTISGGQVSHVGQLFYDQDLINAVTELEPYSSNTAELTLNEDDGILAQEAEDVDPIVNYVYLGGSVADGILAWTSFGVDSGASRDVRAAVVLGENGGVVNENSGGGPGGNGPGGPGGPPSNSSTSFAPSGGTATSTAADATAGADTTTGATASATVRLESPGD